ncbi:MAG: armadillo-type protein [Linnemannia gamsii]|nr:MAG: armadillo-type protein [Linnemannia gamsii]
MVFFISNFSDSVFEQEICFVNLVIVESPAQREKEKQNLKKQADVFHRTPSSEAVQGSNVQSSIPLEQLFDKRKLCNGKENVPKRILVQGRAGIGKTTLCKKLAHEHQNGLWKDRFDAVLWLPLRQLRGSTSRTLESLLREKFFDTQQLDQEQEELARTLTVRAEEGKVLFVLDGLDEVATDAQCEGNSLIPLLRTLLGQHYVVITSRPLGLNKLLLPQIDLELETVEFSQQNVKDFVVKILDPGPARIVQDFIQQAPLIQGLVNIPVQLDVVCFCWHSLPIDGSQVTITKLYQLMVRKLWCKDAHRLKKMAGDQVLIEEEVNDLSPEDIDELMTVEMHHLGYLAFKGLKNSQQTWSFLHLTFQEYFAATWIVSKMTATGDNGHSLSAGSMKNKSIIHFVQEHKYNPRLKIVWWMVAGLLEVAPLDSDYSWKKELVETLGSRSTLSESAIQSLIGALKDDNDDVRSSAASVLDNQSTLSESAIQSLIGALKNENDIVRRSVVLALGNQSILSESAIQSLLGALKDNNDNVRWSAKSALGNQSTLPESAMQSLIGALKDKNDDVRSSAASVLGKQSILSKSAIQFLITTFRDENDDVRSSAMLVLGKQSLFCNSPIQPLIDALKDDKAYARRSAALALSNQSLLSEFAMQSLTDALKDEDDYIRTALKDKNDEVRRSAASALGSQWTLPDSAIQPLIDSLEDENDDVRSSAASAFGNQSILSESAIQPLIGALRKENNYVRRSAASALGKQSILSESAVQPLIDALKNENDYVRSSAVSALGKQSILSEAAIQSLIGALKNEDDYVTRSAASELGNQSTLSESAIRSLIDAFEDEYDDVRCSAALVLGNQSILSESTIQLLMGAFKDENDDVRWSAVSALGKQTVLSKSAIQSLIGALKDKDRLADVSYLYK